MYDFDEIIDRKGTNALNTDGFREYLFQGDRSLTFPCRDDELIRMWVADMEFAVPGAVVEAVKRRLDRRIFGYTSIFDEAYYRAFAGWCLRRYGWSFPREHLVTSNGVVPALDDLVEHIGRPEDKVLFLTPSYGPFKRAADRAGRPNVCSDLVCADGKYSLDFADLAEKAADEKTSLFILCHPHNPTGRVWTEEELKKLGEICLENGLWIISDEIHCDLARRGRVHTPLAALFPDSDRIITCMAPSKTFNLAGLMMSNVIIPNDELRKAWLARGHGFENPLSLAAAQAAYEEGEDWLEALRGYLDLNFSLAKDCLARELPRAGFEIPEATYLAWVDLRAYFAEGEDLSRFFAQKAGVLLEGGGMFVRNGEGFVRLNLACPRAVAAEGLKRICRAVNERP